MAPEARAAAAVNHPNVCQIDEIGEEDGELFLAMELLEGEPLAQVLERAPLPVSEAVQIMLGVLGALEALHRRQLAHRDLKPSNIFQTAHGVKLLDFGLAGPAQPLAGGSESRTETSSAIAGTIAGTPHLHVPEQFQGVVADIRADIFAAGAILFELLAGRRAFLGRSIVIALFTDPEGVFYMVRHLAYLWGKRRNHSTLFGASSRTASTVFQPSPAIHGSIPCAVPEFTSIFRLAEKRSQQVRAAFLEAQGYHVLAT